MKVYAMLFSLIVLMTVSHKHSNYNTATDISAQYYKPLLTYKGDTLAYLKDNFVDHQLLYKNKELNKLLNRLEVSISGYDVMVGGNYVEGKEPAKSMGIGLYLSKNVPKRLYEVKHKKGKYPFILNIIFKNPFLYENSFDLLHKFGLRFTDSVRHFYSRKLIDSVYLSKGDAQ
jgi:hypothetical protein